MKQLIKPALVVLLLLAGAYGAWCSLMSGRVAQVKATIAYHNQQLKAVTPNMVLKTDEVYAAGFPFRSEVRVSQLTLSMVEGDETYLVRVPLVRVDRVRQGMNVQIGSEVDALYAKNGQTPEHYHVTLSDAIGVVLTMPEKEGEPFMRYRLFLPKQMGMVMTLNGESKEAIFQLVPFNFMVDQAIPSHAERPLWLFVSILREALVFKKEG